MTRQATRVGRYQLMDRIAHGGMAEIHRGVTYLQDGHRRDIAVKKLLPKYTADRQFTQMLTDEFKLVSYLKHPNIAEVYELAEIDESLIIAMEYVDGKDLRSTVEKCRRRRMPLGFDDVAYIIARALDGLHHAHVARDDRGKLLHIVHRDFSPSNILLGYSGQVKICDFGIAKATMSHTQTQTGIIKGKVKYMSPEQAFGKTLDWRSDIFSAGSVLYELATGMAPFRAKTERDLIFSVRDAAPPLARKINPHLPEELEAIIAKAMARSRSARFQSCIDFRNALLGFLQVYNPKYRRSHLAHFLKDLWAVEIERELRSLEDFVLDEIDAMENLGTNLIAEALGPDAPFSQFSPLPTRSEVGAEALSEGNTQQVEAHAAETETATAAPDTDAESPSGPRSENTGTVPLSPSLLVDADDSKP
ncbi:MAG: serine/threonine protein kinase [Myxococcales bacterium]|nr:serine/threonine protein kinase [Myxococcales bacterium]